MTRRELLAWAALAPDEREGLSPVPLGDCHECGAPPGTYDPECDACLAAWLSEPGN